MINNIIFDFNGTLIFDGPLHNLAWQKVSKEIFNLDLDLATIKTYFHGAPNNEAIEKIQPNKYNLAEKIKISQYKEQCYRDILIENKLPLVKGAPSFFDYLKLHNYHFTIASASIIENIDFLYQYYQLNRWFNKDLIIYDNNTYLNKELMFLDACKAINCTIDQTIILEDSLSGVNCAIKAGCTKIILIYDKSYNPVFDTYPQIIYKATNYIDVLSFISEYSINLSK